MLPLKHFIKKKNKREQSKLSTAETQLYHVDILWMILYAPHRYFCLEWTCYTLDPLPLFFVDEPKHKNKNKK